MKQRSAFFSQRPEPSHQESARREMVEKYLADSAETKRPPRGLARLLVVVLCIFVAGFFLETAIPVPDTVWVYVDDRQGVYYAPTFLRDSGQDEAGLLLTTVGLARKMKYAPDPKAKSLGYFEQPTRSMSGGLLQSLGLLPPLKHRWNRDGTWNW